MQTHLFTGLLHPHGDFPPRAVSSVEVRIISMDANWLRVRWRVDGSNSLVVPPFGGRGRADELWKTTCFELFARLPGESAYIEINLSPSERWAAYDLVDYRSSMTHREMPREPECTMRRGSSFAIFDAAIPAVALPGPAFQFGMSAVIEEEGGSTSYWALAHPVGKPDFHHPACFAASLEAPQNP